MDYGPRTRGGLTAFPRLWRRCLMRRWQRSRAKYLLLRRLRWWLRRNFAGTEFCAGKPSPTLLQSSHLRDTTVRGRLFPPGCGPPSLAKEPTKPLRRIAHRRDPLTAMERDVVASLGSAIARRIGEPRYDLWFTRNTKF